MACQHAAAAKASQREHLFHRLAEDPAQHDIRFHALADVFSSRARGFVKTEREIEIFEGVPEAGSFEGLAGGDAVGGELGAGQGDLLDLRPGQVG